MPRQLVEDSSLPRALALRQSGSQIVSMIGGPIGGALVALAGFTAASPTDSVSFGVVLAALICIRPRFAALGAVMMGVGTAAFVCNLAPVLMGTTPRSHLARIQALLSLAQSGALLIFNNVLGAVAHVASAAGAMITCASIVFGCALVAIAVPTIRRVGAPLNAMPEILAFALSLILTIRIIKYCASAPAMLR
jgi:hypothetical protein